MRYAGSDSWTISIREWEQQLEWALWLRAAERIPVPAGGAIPGPLDIDPLPEPTTDAGEALADGWRFWWHAVLNLQSDPRRGVGTVPGGPLSEGWFVPPDFEALAPHPELQRLVAARWPEMAHWQNARKSAGMAALRDASGPANRLSCEGDIVRAVEAEIGHRAAPFALCLVLIPVADDEFRSLGARTFLVPEHLRGTPTYANWLHRLIRAVG
ncbi:hypothetical protein [Streptacidiphilus carbonis]|jgi:hypothetical protein|uniref:hypothetical protein n=1 Tax=Streptacidiphilus carbonis TaxID=105422 RepID=UPI0005A6C106|nr:hypothetical protein [Streptacidiphilus carbonis]